MNCTQPNKSPRTLALMLVGATVMFVVVITAIFACVFSDQNNNTPTVAAQETPAVLPEALPQETEENSVEILAETPEADDDYFSETLFIGNSITGGFKAFSGLNTPTYYEGRGMTVESIYRMKVVNADNSPNDDRTGDKTILEALRDKQYNQIYLLMGTNELGWVYPEKFIEQYAQLIDDIQALQPNAKLCVQSVLPVSESRSQTDDIYNNEKIENLNRMITDLAAQKKIPYLNAAEAFQNENGALPEDETPDGIHLGAQACKRWRMYIKTHIIP